MRVSIPMVALGLLLQPTPAAFSADKDGVVRVQLEGTLVRWGRPLDGTDRDVGASVRAGGGEFLLDLSNCADGRKRLAAFVEQADGKYIALPQVKVAGRLEFRSVLVIDAGQPDKPAAPGPPRPVLIVDSFSLIEPGTAKEEKPAALKVTLGELAKEPAKFHGKLVQVEGVIQQTQILKEKQGDFDYRLVVGKGDSLMAWCAGKLAVSKGDTIRITGVFRHDPAAANPFRILVDDKNGKVGKTTPKKPE